MQLWINVIQFWASIASMIPIIKLQCHYCCYYCYYSDFYHYGYYHFHYYHHYYFSWCSVFMNALALCDPVVRQVLSKSYWKLVHKFIKTCLGWHGGGLTNVAYLYVKVIDCLVKYSWIYFTVFSCDQAALKHLCPSVRPSVRLSVHPSVAPFSLCSHHRIIMKFSEVITNDRSDVHAKGQGQRSKVKVNTLFSHFRNVTPVWIHIWGWNDAQSLKWLRRGALLFFKVVCQISRSRGAKKNRDFDPNWMFLDCNSILNSHMAIKWCTKHEVA